MYNASGEVIYVGKAKNLKNRVSSYFSGSKDAKTTALVLAVKDIEFTITLSEVEALILECELIQQYKPKYNIIFKDSKSYPYLVVTKSDKYPSLQYYRGTKKNPKDEYFGPYPNSQAVRDSLVLLQKMFRLRNCENAFFNNRSRPCLQHQIKRCSAPCTKLISVEDYAQDTKRACQFLAGSTNSLLDELSQKMHDLAAKENYEQAAQVRDQIRILNNVIDSQVIIGSDKNIDVLAIAQVEHIFGIQMLTIRKGRMLGSKSFINQRPNALVENKEQVLTRFIFDHYFNHRGLSFAVPDEIVVNLNFHDISQLTQALQKSLNKKINIIQLAQARADKIKWLQMSQQSIESTLLAKLDKDFILKSQFDKLAKALDIEKLQTIQGFDISHTMGDYTVGACVEFTKKGPNKANYRKFNIRNLTGGDDYLALEEAITRHLQQALLKNTLPDLLIIDGGKGQLKRAEQVCANLGISLKLLSMAKGSSRKPGLETLFLTSKGRTLELEPSDSALHLLQAVRDESHRFALTGHKSRRGKAIASKLEQIPGIGPNKRTKLLQRFGGLNEVKNASIESLAKVPGISIELATRIYNAIRDV